MTLLPQRSIFSILDKKILPEYFREIGKDLENFLPFSVSQIEEFTQKLILTYSEIAKYFTENGIQYIFGYQAS